MRCAAPSSRRRTQVVQAGRRSARRRRDRRRADAAAKCVDEVQEFGVPLGWSHDTSPHNVCWDGVGKMLGLLVTAFALSLGAPFWFDLLGKVSNLRGAGPAAPAAGEKAS